MSAARTRLVGVLLDPEAERLTLTWGDGHESVLPLALLRSRCPCASCRHYREQASSGGLSLGILPPEIANASPHIDELQPVGRYALQPIWTDGHSTGIFTYDYLRDLCPCDACRAERQQDRS